VASELLDTVKEFLFPGRFVRRSISPLDAGLTPNDRLEHLQASFIESLPEPEAVLVVPDGRVLVTNEDELLVFDRSGARRQLARFPGMAGPIARESSGTLLVGVAGVGVVRVDPDSGVVSDLCVEAEDERLHCPTDLAVASDGTIYCTDGSTAHSGDEWVHDLMEQRSLGRLVRIDPGTGGASVLLRGLAYPSGITLTHDESGLVLCEAWNHRLTSLSREGDGGLEVLRDNMPGYPGRISTAPDGTYWLAIFALRTQLVDFVLGQRDYVTEMMRTIEPDFWIRPALRSLNSGLEPLQGGQIRKLGVIKPWAPPRSYGLAVRLDEHGDPLESLHSRGGATRHGVTAVHQVEDELAICIRGGRQVLVARKEELE
jgi:hypothetical protein